MKITPEEAVSDVINTMNKYSALDQNNDNTDLKRQLEIFQGAYVRESQRQKMYGWCTRITQIRFLSKLILGVITEHISPDEASRNYITAIECDNALGNIEGKEVSIMRQKMISLSKLGVPKVFNGKPLQRVFWHVMDRDNLPKLTELITAP